MSRPMMKPDSLYSILLLVTVLIFAACEQNTEQAYSHETETMTGMLQHNVYFYLNDGVTAREAEEFEAGLKELLQIESIYKSELGVPAATEDRDVTDHDFAYTIFTWFQTMEDYDIYADHPDHLEFIDRFNGLWADVKVYDADITFEQKK
jgi:hypothetical protein